MLILAAYPIFERALEHWLNVINQQLALIQANVCS